MKSTLKFVLLGAWIVASRLFDILSTYQHTPDLKKEANPLASVLGLGWTPILIIVGGLTCYVVYALYLSIYNPFDLYPSEKNYSLSEFSGFVYSGKKESWFVAFYKLPNSVARFHQYAGEVFTLCLAYAGVVSTLMWLLIQHTEFYKKLHSTTLIFSILIAGCLIINWLWNRKHYQFYLQN